jgi:hypothetical protein
LKQDLDQAEADEQAKYERKLEQMRREVAQQTSSLNVEHELQLYKEQLEGEYEQQMREYRRQLEAQQAAEEDKMDKKRQREVKEYEQMITD